MQDKKYRYSIVLSMFCLCSETNCILINRQAITSAGTLVAFSPSLSAIFLGTRSLTSISFDTVDVLQLWKLRDFWRRKRIRLLKIRFFGGYCVNFIEEFPHVFSTRVFFLLFFYLCFLGPLDYSPSKSKKSFR